MRKITVLLIVLLSFLWTGCSTVHQKSPSDLLTASRMSEAPSQAFTVRFPHVFIDNTPVTNKHIKDAVFASLETKLNAQNRTDAEGEWCIFTFSRVEWVSENALKIEKKRSLRADAKEIGSLVRTYSVTLDIAHDAEKNEFAVRLVPENIVLENSTEGYYSQLTGNVYASSQYDNAQLPAFTSGGQDAQVVDVVSATAQDLVDYNKNLIHYTKQRKETFSTTLDGDPILLRKLFADYLEDHESGAVVTEKGVYYAGKQLVCIVESDNAMTYLCDLDIPEEVGLKGTGHRQAGAEWYILSLVKRYLTLS